jgi:hypothetical protein
MRWRGIVLSTKVAEPTGFPYAKEWNWVLALHRIQELTENGSKT